MEKPRNKRSFTSAPDILNQQPNPEDIWTKSLKPVPNDLPKSVGHLIAAESILINQRIDLIDEFIGWETPNCFTIMDENGKHMYYATESSNCFNMFWCGGQRKFTVKIFDNDRSEVIRLIRPIGEIPCCFFCCSTKMKVFSPPGVYIGAVKNTPHVFKMNFTIKNAEEKELYKILGPPRCFPESSVCCHPEFKIMTAEKPSADIGVIEKFQSDYLNKWFFSKQTFILRIPADTDVYDKILFLASLFLVRLKRTGWVLRNIEDPETVSGHMYRMSIMTFLIPEFGVDKTRCMKLSLVHDLAECIVGDITPYCGVEASEKHRKEDEAMKQLTQMVGDSGIEIYQLYKEYEAQLTEESKLVKDLDRLDMILQAYEYEKSSGHPKKLEEFFESTMNRFHNPWTINIVKELYRQRNLHKNQSNG